MWLLPAFSWISRTACRVFYRLEIHGELPAGARRPVLIVANHPNSLLDPALVAAAARRPVRFLAKQPLFNDAKVGWLIRASGSIPVQRRVDRPGMSTASNDSMFEAVHNALGSGAAIGIFPEGLSHSEPELQQLRTGAARIALGAAVQAPDLQIVPAGLVLADKATFRSRALVLLGEPIHWDDLRTAAVEREAVEELTGRIRRGLSEVTVNCDRWEDLPALECGEQIWLLSQGVADRPDDAQRPAEGPDNQDGPARATEASAPRAPEITGPEFSDEILRVGRLRHAAEALRRWRSQPDGDPELLQDLNSHAQRLRDLELRPSDLARRHGLTAAARWSVRRLHLLGLPALLVAGSSWLLFWPPFRATGGASALMNRPRDQVATYKLMVGFLIYAAWLCLLSFGAALTVMRLEVGHSKAPLMAAGAALGAWGVLPALGMLGLWIRERWRAAAGDLRRFLAQRSRRELLEELRNEQRELAQRIRSQLADR